MIFSSSKKEVVLTRIVLVDITPYTSKFLPHVHVGLFSRMVDLDGVE